jgi:hypothetical protein
MPLISRKGAKHVLSEVEGAAAPEKPETRNPKFETNPNDQNARNFKQTRFGFRFFDFRF